MNYDDAVLQPYSGSIDGLLEKCANLDADAIDQQVEEYNKSKVLYNIMEQFDCTHEEAQVLYDEAVIGAIKEQLDILVAAGKVKIVGEDEDGNPLYAAADEAKEKSAKVPRKKS
jgi:hypothetical protein